MFDRDRPVTTLEHQRRLVHEGPEWARREAYWQWATLVDKLPPEDAERQVAHYMDIAYSIHFQAWTQKELVELFLFLNRERGIDFDFETIMKNGDEVIVICRKGEG
jgi:hypothetical protein